MARSLSTMSEEKKYRILGMAFLLTGVLLLGIGAPEYYGDSESGALCVPGTDYGFPQSYVVVDLDGNLILEKGYPIQCGELEGPMGYKPSGFCPDGSTILPCPDQIFLSNGGFSDKTFNISK